MREPADVNHQLTLKSFSNNCFQPDSPVVPLSLGITISCQDLVHRVEATSKQGFLICHGCAQLIQGGNPMLETPLLVDWHTDTCDGSNSICHHAALELVKFVMLIIGQFDIGNSLSNLDDSGPGEWAEAMKSKVF